MEIFSDVKMNALEEIVDICNIFVKTLIIGTHCKHRFRYLKVGFKGIYITWKYYPDNKRRTIKETAE